MRVIFAKVLIVLVAFCFWWLMYGLECWINGAAALDKGYPLSMHIESLKQDWTWLWKRPGPEYPGPLHFIFWHVGFLVLPTVSAFCW